MREAVVAHVRRGSPADEAGLKRGDIIGRINGETLRDIIDYQVISDECHLSVEAIRKGERLTFEIKKDRAENLGLKFSSSIFDRQKTCANRCVFCFIDQNPPGLRTSLYFKDDDYRLSFLYGNFITLTNLKPDEVKRIIVQRISPLYVSLHATNPDLRRRMLGLRGQDTALDVLDRLLKAGIEVHTQIVLCPGINDGKELERTINDLIRDYRQIASVGIVPVGLTAYQKNLELRPLTRKACLDLIRWAAKIQKLIDKKIEKKWIFLADEFYLRAGLSVPGREYYGDFPQSENGIGLTRLFIDDVKGRMKQLESEKSHKTFTVFTGELFSPVLNKMADEIMIKLGIRLNVHAVPNRFFGGHVSVAGLLTGSDLITYVQDLPAPLDSPIYLIPDTMLNQDKKFLDDLSLSDLNKMSSVPFQVVPSQGKRFVDWLAEKR